MGRALRLNTDYQETAERRMIWGEKHIRGPTEVTVRGGYPAGSGGCQDVRAVHFGTCGDGYQERLRVSAPP